MAYNNQNCHYSIYNAPSVVSLQKGLRSSTKVNLFFLQITDASSEHNTATGRPNASFTKAWPPFCHDWAMLATGVTFHRFYLSVLLQTRRQWLTISQVNSINLAFFNWCYHLLQSTPFYIRVPSRDIPLFPDNHAMRLANAKKVALLSFGQNSVLYCVNWNRELGYLSKSLAKRAPAVNKLSARAASFSLPQLSFTVLGQVSVF